MLKIEAVSKRFRAGNYGVRDLSLEVKSGVIGLLGPNGAGKTTLMQMLATITRPTKGRILFRGEDVVRRPNPLRRKLGYLPQDFGVYDNLTATEFMTYFAALKGVRSRKRIPEMLESVNLHGVANRTVGGFFGGTKQRPGGRRAGAGPEGRGGKRFRETGDPVDPHRVGCGIDRDRDRGDEGGRAP